MVQYVMFRGVVRKLKKERLFREIRNRESRQGRAVRIDGRDFLNFSSNDYLGLASDGELIDHTLEILRRFGVGSGSSRLLAGGTSIHAELERTAAFFKDTEDAVVFNSGYTANTGAIPALMEKGDALFSDELNHASIIDGCRLSGAKRFVYHHCDIDELRNLIRKSDARRKMVVTDTVFSMDGDIAPLREIYDLCRDEGAALYLDDAHGTGVLGRGRGALEHFGLEAKDFVIQMGTLSKAIGSFGAFIAADGNVIDCLINRARTLIYSTALPPVAAAYGLTAMKKIMTDGGRTAKLWANIETAHKGFDMMGISKGESSVQIIPVIFESVEEASDLAAYLYEKAIYAPVIRPPSVKKPRIRISITASHTEDDIHILLGAVGEYFEKKG